MDAWTWLLDTLILLSAALVLGSVAEQLKQNAIVGYLLAGMLVGPNALGWVGSREEVNVIAELGVTLLLFTIGLEFSLKRLIRLGPITYLGGTVQVILTAAAGYAVSAFSGLGWQASAALGMMVALSSTACVVRMLVDTAQIDCIFGRNAVGILLLQDIALVPLVLVTVALGGESTPSQALWMLLRSVALGAAMIGAFYVIFNHLIPKVLGLRSWSKNRELPVLLAVVMSVGSALAAHKAGLSPSFGAFLAGLLLAESPFAVQIRSDVASLRTLLVTLFFAAIGMLVNPVWVMRNWALVGGMVALIVIVKPLIVWGIVRPFRFSNGIALATGVCLGQVGEFSFVLAKLAENGGIIDREIFRLVVSGTVLTLFVTPYLVRAAPMLAQWAEKKFPVHKMRPAIVSIGTPVPLDSTEPGRREEEKPVVIVGFGPAGRRVAEVLLPKFGKRLFVLDLNPGSRIIAESYGLEFHIGDARQIEVLEHFGVRQASVVVITVPDPDSCRQIIYLAKFLAPEALIVSRSRYHIHQWDLLMAGAEKVVDEESQVGQRLAEEVLKSVLDQQK
ncbi:MAG TPA: cation:proton antiporter [archaeon]|nr:cation:proton antiporter [archaeon]